MSQKKRYDSTRQWYAIHTYSGYEEKVAESINQRVESVDMADKIFGVMVPKEKMIEIKNGKRKVVEKKIFQGYVLVDMKMTEDAWYIVRNTPGVTGFLGGSGKPAPLSRDEYNKMMRKTDKGSSAPKRAVVDIEVGTSIRVTNGPLADFDGKVSEVMPEQGKVKVTLLIFGRETPVELGFEQIEVIA